MLSDQVILQDQQTSEDSYDSEDMMHRGRTEMMAIRESDKMIKPLHDSMVNMGENLTKDNIKELKKMKKEFVDTNIDPKAAKQIATSELLPKYEESKASAANAARGRYAQPDEAEEINLGGAVILTEEGADNNGQAQMMLAASH